MPLMSAAALGASRKTIVNAEAVSIPVAVAILLSASRRGKPLPGLASATSVIAGTLSPCEP